MTRQLIQLWVGTSLISNWAETLILTELMKRADNFLELLLADEVCAHWPTAAALLRLTHSSRYQSSVIKALFSSNCTAFSCLSTKVALTNQCCLMPDDCICADPFFSHPCTNAPWTHGPKSFAWYDDWWGYHLTENIIRLMKFQWFSILANKIPAFVVRGLTSAMEQSG